MLLLFILLTAFALAGVAIARLHSDPNSYVLLTLGDVSVETSLGVALAVLLVLCLLIIILWSLVSSGGSVWRSWLGVRRRGQTKKLNQLLLTQLSGEYASADRQLTNIGKDTLGDFTHQVLNAYYLLQQGQTGAAQKLLDALESDASGRLERDLLLRLRAELLARQNDYAGISRLALPGYLQRKSYWHSALLEAAAHTEDWGRVYKLLQRKNDPVDKQLWLRLFEQHSQSLPLDRTWSNAPAQLKQHPDFVLAYVYQLRRAGRFSAAQQLLLKSAENSALEPCLIELGNFPLDKPTAFFHKLERIYHLKQGDRAYLALGLGKLCLELGLYGKSEDYLQPLTTHQDKLIRHQANLAMARLHAQLGQHDQASGYVDKLGEADS